MYLFLSAISIQLTHCSIIRIEKCTEVIKEIPPTCKSISWGTTKDSELEGIWEADSSDCPAPGIYEEMMEDGVFSDDCHWGNYKIDFTWHDLKISGTSVLLNNERIKWEGSGDWYTDKKNLFFCVDWIKTYYRQKGDFSIDTIYKRDTINRQLSKFEYRVYYNLSNLSLTLEDKVVYLHNVNSKYYKKAE